MKDILEEGRTMRSGSNNSGPHGNKRAEGDQWPEWNAASDDVELG